MSSSQHCMSRSQHCMRHMQQHPTVQVDCLLYHEDTLLEKWRWLDSKLQQDTVWLQSSLLGSTSLLGMAHPMLGS